MYQTLDKDLLRELQIFIDELYFNCNCDMNGSICITCRYTFFLDLVLENDEPQAGAIAFGATAYVI